MCKVLRWRQLPSLHSVLQPQRFPSRFLHISRSARGSVAESAPVGAPLDVFAEDKRPVILFDGVCNFCNGGVNLVLSLDDQEAFRFAALQSTVGKELLHRCHRHPKDISSMVLVEENAFHIRSDAALRIGEKLKIPFPILSAMFTFVPKPVRDRGYDWIADNRYKLFGIRDQCRISDRRYDQRFLS